jgi:hypothetical protein
MPPAQVPCLLELKIDCSRYAKLQNYSNKCKGIAKTNNVGNRLSSIIVFLRNEV